jgi:hypothetical protein
MPDLKQLIEDFDQAAKSWGWMEDMGTGSGVDEAEKLYKTSKEALVKAISLLDLDPNTVPKVHHIGVGLQCIADNHADVLNPREIKTLYIAARKLW